MFFKNEYEYRLALEFMIDLFESVEDMTEEDIINELENELKKPENERDYDLIHECKLTLCECFGHEYNNEYVEAAKISREKNKAEMKRLKPTSKE